MTHDSNKPTEYGEAYSDVTIDGNGVVQIVDICLHWDVSTSRLIFEGPSEFSSMNNSYEAIPLGKFLSGSGITLEDCQKALGV